MDKLVQGMSSFTQRFLGGKPTILLEYAAIAVGMAMSGACLLDAFNAVMA